MKFGQNLQNVQNLHRKSCSHSVNRLFLSGFSINATFLGTFFGAGMGYSSFNNCRCTASSIK